MHFLAVLNRGGGILRTTDLDALTATMVETLGRAGHTIDIRVVGAGEIDPALHDAASATADAVMVGGGDGTVSAAAACLMNTGKVLAILPAGTMNLFARSLGIPLSLEDAIESFATGRVREVDVASANGRPFVHQFAIGLHARLVKLRSRRQFGSRLGKVWASLTAAIQAAANPQLMRIELTMNGSTRSVTTTGIGISNNLFGPGHLPYADVPDGGRLGVYIAKARSRLDLAWLFIKIAIGQWQTSERLEVHQASVVKLKAEHARKRVLCLIDGELSLLQTELEIVQHPRCLRVLVPNS